ncbi:Uncharacterised protein [Escherichia coli]|nr:Uncharacterised protein [Escherichia coli]
MKQFTVAAVNGGMIGHRCAKAAQQDIARLCRGQGHPVKAGDRHIVQVKVLTVAPPVILTHKIRQRYPRQMVCIPEQGVTVRHPVLKTTPRSGAAHSGICEFPPGRPATRAGHSLSAAAGRPRSARADHQGGCEPAPQSPPASLLQPVFRRNTKIRLRLCGDIHAGLVPFALRGAYHEAARLCRRTPPGMHQNR